MEDLDYEWATEMMWRRMQQDRSDPAYLEYSYSIAKAGGEESCEGFQEYLSMERELYKSQLCYGCFLQFTNKDETKLYFKAIPCSKPWCPKCGGYNGNIHEQRQHSVYRRLIRDKIALRQIVFTIPMELREYFMNQHALNALIDICHRVIEKHFGILHSVKKSKTGKVKEKMYHLSKGAIAYVHLFGGGQGFDPNKFHPHINVHIVEKKSDLLNEDSLSISKNMLEAIKKSYRSALKSYVVSTLKFNKEVHSNIFNKIDMAVVHYSPKYDTFAIDNTIRDMTRPLDVEFFNKLKESANIDMLRFLLLGLKRFRFIRFWGGLSDSHHKETLKYYNDGEDIEDNTRDPLGWKLIRFLSVDRFIKFMEQHKLENQLRHTKICNAMQVQMKSLAPQSVSDIVKDIQAQIATEAEKSADDLYLSLPIEWIDSKIKAILLEKGVEFPGAGIKKLFS